jgi:hypothetical protein
LLKVIKYYINITKAIQNTKGETNTNAAIFQLYHGEKKIICQKLMMRFGLYQTNTLSLIFDSASSQKQQSADRHVAPLGHIILILSQTVFALSP